MDTVGRVVATRDGRGATLSRIIDEIKRDNIKPTHFLLSSFMFAKTVPEGTRTKVRSAFFNKLNKKEFSLSINGDPEDVIKIKWFSCNKHSACVYYAICRLDETYVRQLTRVCFNQHNIM